MRWLEQNPGKYIDKVWGEHEVGGTSVLYISDIDLSFLTHGLSLGSEPMRETTEAAMNAVPLTFAGVAALMSGINWVIGRRMKVEAEPESAGSWTEDSEDA